MMQWFVGAIACYGMLEEAITTANKSNKWTYKSIAVVFFSFTAIVQLSIS